MTQADLAREFDLNPSSVSRSIRRHGIPVTPEGLVDRDLFVALRRERIDREQQRRAQGKKKRAEQPAASGDTGPGSSPPAVEAGESWTQRRERAEALTAELKLRVLAGELVDIAELEKRWAAHLAAVLVQMEAIPDRFSAAHGIDDDHRRRIRQGLRDELDQVRRALARPA